MSPSDLSAPKCWGPEREAGPERPRGMGARGCSGGLRAAAAGCGGQGAAWGAGGGVGGRGRCGGPPPLGLSTPPPGCGRTSRRAGSEAPGEPSEPWPGLELGSFGARDCRGRSEGQSREPRRGARTAEGRVPEPSEAPKVAASAVTWLGWQVQAARTKNIQLRGGLGRLSPWTPHRRGGGGCGGANRVGSKPCRGPPTTRLRTCSPPTTPSSQAGVYLCQGQGLPGPHSVLLCPETLGPWESPLLLPPRLPRLPRLPPTPGHSRSSVRTQVPSLCPAGTSPTGFSAPQGETGREIEVP